MASRAAHSWTFGGLIVAFYDLALAYFLLCGSAVAFFTSEFLRIFGLWLPCPCIGILGYRNSNLCLHQLLFDCPRRKIYYVQQLAKNRFPFDSIWDNDQAMVPDLESDESCSSFKVKRSQNLVNREIGCDVKGKGIVNQKQRASIRRRRRAVGEHRKFASVLPLDSPLSPSILAGVSSVPTDGKTIKSSGVVSKLEDGLQHVEPAQIGNNIGERSWHSFELSGLFDENKDMDTDSFSAEKFTCTARGKLEVVGDELGVMRAMQQALEEERAATDALYLELEKERAAAAVAANEAMAMILRLQKDKASLEMEARQNQRMTEEKFAYDEEEMNVLQEILLRIAKENHLLEKELEAYRKMSSLGPEDDPSSLMDDNLKKCSSLMVQQFEKNRFIGDIEVGKTSCKSHSSVLDAEMTVHDVHVVDDNNEIWKVHSGEKCGREVLSDHPESRNEFTPETYSGTVVRRDSPQIFGPSKVQNGKLLLDHTCTSSAESGASISITSVGTDEGLEGISNLHVKEEKLSFPKQHTELKLLEETVNIEIQHPKESAW